MALNVFEEAREFAFPFYQKLPSSKNVMQHVDLVDSYIVSLCEKENCLPLVPRLAGIFHEIGKTVSQDNYATQSAELALDFLDEASLFSFQRDEILQAIRSHQHTFSGSEDKLSTKVVQSADVLAQLFEPGWEKIDFSQVPATYIEEALENFDQRLTLPTARNWAATRMQELRDALER
ncbi:MAG: HD domain-containing protein [Candidatus Nanoarchaeia archaeon]